MKIKDTKLKNMCYNMNMKKFYIFLDIDGVMWDWDYIISETDAGRRGKGGMINSFKPESIEALNLLISQLGRTHDVQLVISSSWKGNMARTTKVLKDSGLLYDKRLARTPTYSTDRRGEEILIYLNNNNKSDFVIIDDEMFDYSLYFKKENIIKCEINHSALSLKNVEEFLKNSAFER